MNSSVTSARSKETRASSGPDSRAVRAVAQAPMATLASVV